MSEFSKFLMFRISQSSAITGSFQELVFKVRSTYIEVVREFTFFLSFYLEYASKIVILCRDDLENGKAENIG